MLEIVLCCFKTKAVNAKKASPEWNISLAFGVHGIAEDPGVCIDDPGLCAVRDRKFTPNRMGF